eukprot:NODE_11947_length_1256_cov_2.597874.p2 GENE.NODE_11947_length_1256_cov_2.597874~~NODE_11947_length_1256_cov_2.597874.p2  ORF type:complete len:146 (+),score=32.61 NODE_11947_length_1256_cov_2.597874:387-824(+)
MRDRHDRRHGLARAGCAWAMSTTGNEWRTLGRPPTYHGVEACWQSLKFVIRSYLAVLHERAARLLEAAEALAIYVDADWSDKWTDTRSTSGGAIRYYGCTLLTWARRQATRALSSAESELYELGTGSIEALGIAQRSSSQNGVSE